MKTIFLARSLRSLEFAGFTKGIYSFFVPEIPEIEGISGRRSRWIHDLSESIGKNTSFVSLSVLCGLCEKQVFALRFMIKCSSLFHLPASRRLSPGVLAGGSGRPSVFLSKYRFQILVRCGNRFNVIILHEDVEDIGRNKCR